MGMISSFEQSGFFPTAFCVERGSFPYFSNSLRFLFLEIKSSNLFFLFNKYKRRTSWFQTDEKI